MRFFLLSFLSLVLMPSMAFAMETLAKQAYIIDYETGQVLYEKNAHDRMPTSSMSKTLTGYVAFDMLESGRITLDQEFPVSEKAWRMQGSKMFVPLGGMVKVEDLIRGVLVQSGNDATIVLAEGIAGTEEQFVEIMNRTAQELGMKDSHFMNASGWPDPNHYSTAHDLTLLGRALIKNHPKHYHYDSEKEFTYNNIKQGNRNPLLYLNIGADGIKTGHTSEAGYGLMGSALRGDRRVVMVLNGMASMNERAQESARLMEWALASFVNANIFQKGTKVADAPVAMGVERWVPLIVQEDLKLTLPRGSAAGRGIKATASFKGPLEAPVKQGQQVGIVRVEIPNMHPIELPVYAAKDIPRLGFFPSMLEKLERIVFGESIPASPAAATQAPAAAEQVPDRPAKPVIAPEDAVTAPSPIMPLEETQTPAPAAAATPATPAPVMEE